MQFRRYLNARNFSFQAHRRCGHSRHLHEAPAQRRPMPSMSLYRATEELLAKASIQIGGSNPWDMQIRKPGVPEQAFLKGNLGLGEAYMDGAWEADALDEFFARLLGTRLTDGIQPWRLLGHRLVALMLDRQNRRRAKVVGERHYDLGNDFYASMLDSRMTYTCGYWAEAETLEQAQEAKLEMICRKLKLAPGMRV